MKETLHITYFCICWSCSFPQQGAELTDNSEKEQFWNPEQDERMKTSEDLTQSDGILRFKKKNFY